MKHLFIINEKHKNFYAMKNQKNTQLWTKYNKKQQNQ